VKLSTGRLALIALAVGVGVAVGGIAYASIPDANGVIHGCYNSDNGALRVFGKSKDFQQCNAGEKPLDWSQTGPTGLTGPTGPTGTSGATGPTGPTGTLSSAFLDAYHSLMVPQVVAVGGAVSFDTVFNVSGITLTGGTNVTVTATGFYQVTVDLQAGSSIIAQLSLNGVGVGPSISLVCGVVSCTFMRLLFVQVGDVVRLVNSGASDGVVYPGSGITIVRIA
jgi:hypothetical protein